MNLAFSSSRSDTTPLLNNSTQDRMFDTMSVEIEQLLAKVSKFSLTSGPWKASKKTVMFYFTEGEDRRVDFSIKIVIL